MKPTILFAALITAVSATPIYGTGSDENAQSQASTSAQAVSQVQQPTYTSTPTDGSYESSGNDNTDVTMQQPTTQQSVTQQNTQDNASGCEWPEEVLEYYRKMKGRVGKNRKPKKPKQPKQPTQEPTGGANYGSSDDSVPPLTYNTGSDGDSTTTTTDNTGNETDGDTYVPPAPQTSSGSGETLNQYGQSEDTGEAQEEEDPAPEGMVTCPDKSGFQFAVQQNTESATSDPTYKSFNPGDYMQATVIQSGVVSKIGVDSNIATAGGQMTYGNATFPCDNTVINLRAYMFVPENGTYTFTCNQADDVAFMWVNQHAAYNDYSRDSANIVQFKSNPAGPVSYTTDLVAGSYVPIRMLFAHGNDTAAFDFHIKSPSGINILDSAKDTQYIIQTKCGAAAEGQWKKYENFGAETY